MSLHGELFAAAQEALLGAFPSHRDLKMMLRRRMGENLDAIVAEGNLETNVFELLEWMEARNRIGELFDAALAERPTDPHLRDVASRIRGSATESDGDRGTEEVVDRDDPGVDGSPFPGPTPAPAVRHLCHPRPTVPGSRNRGRPPPADGHTAPQLGDGRHWVGGHP
jgi:Effector-associated domain 1